MSAKIRKKQYYLIAGAALSIPACFYSILCVVYYVWLNAAEPERWTADRAIIMTSIFAILAVLFFLVFIYCVIKIKRLKGKLS